METGTAVAELALSDAIRAAGLKVTVSRRAVLGVLQASPHSSAEQVFARVREDLPGTSLQAVYSILTAFTASGLVRRFDPAGSAALYECRVGDNHHHVVCVQCGDTQDIDCVVGEAPCLTPSSTGGFSILSAEVTFTGLCSRCSADLATAEA
jgi:Fe2+ or Zn2+ uptake regulation protein